jgi:hypothetical protein
MRCLPLIYEDKKRFIQAYDVAGNEGVPDSWRRVRQGHQRRQSLQATASATTVRRRNGKTISTDRPFFEANEQPAGYYVGETSDI